MLREFLKEKIYGNLTLYNAMLYIKHPPLKMCNPKYKDVVVCSIQRSGSTLLFNLVSSILLEYRNVNDTFFSSVETYNEMCKRELSLLVKKTHSYMPLLGSRIEKGETIAFFSHRDIREIVSSAIQKGMIKDLDSWLNKGGLHKFVNDALLFKKTNKVVFVSYDDLTNNIETVVKKIEYSLNIQLSEEKKVDLIKSNSIDNIKKKIAEIPKDEKLIYSNQLHKNHISENNSKQWDEFISEKQMNKILTIAKDYQKAFNYSH